MPELPEVETVRRGLAPHVEARRVERVVVRERNLRWPVASELRSLLPGATVASLRRRGKYLLFRTNAGTLIAHLGMSGSLRIASASEPAGRHDHVDIRLAGGRILRYNDPRRFGCLLWTRRDPAEHALLRHLGPEPLERELTADYLYERSRKRKLAVKPFIMDSRVVAGVGNIYASEALFLAGIHPARPAGRISLPRYDKLAGSLRQVLAAAVRRGGTTLRDFVGGDGSPGYFRQHLQVYERAGEPCPGCGRKLRSGRIGQRGTVYCGHCQR